MSSQQRMPSRLFVFDANSGEQVLSDMKLADLRQV
jgi:hypothetical protein